MSETEHNYPIYAILLKNDDKIFIQCENDGRIIGFPTEKKALDFWENGYESAFNRGLCGATGAMLTMIQCQPRVVYSNNQNELFKTLFNDPPFSKMTNGGISGILCQKDVKEFWDSGKEPKLIEIENKVKG